MIVGVLLEIIWGVFEVGKSSGCGLVDSFAVHFGVNGGHACCHLETL